MRHHALALVLLSACSSARVGTSETGQPRVVFPARHDSDDGGARPDEAPATAGARVGQLSPPDPQPLRMAEQWEYVVHYARGDVSVDSVRPRDFDEPRVTARRVGRFAVELWIGPELVERVRFDFPLLAAEPAPSGARRPLDEPPSLGAGAESRVRVWVPRSPRATRAVLVDRATGAAEALPWPPDAPIEPVAARSGGDAGPPAAEP